MDKSIKSILRVTLVLFIMGLMFAPCLYIAHNPQSVEATIERGIPFVHNEGRVLWNGNTWWHPGVGEMGVPAVVGGTEVENSFVMPCAGIWKHMLANITTAVPALCSRSLYIRVNGVDQFGVTWAAGESGNKSNLVDTATVAAGDVIVLHGSSAGAGWGAGQSTVWRHALLFVPTDDVIPFIGDASADAGVGDDNITWSALTDGSTLNTGSGGAESHAQCVVPVAGKFKYAYTDQTYRQIVAGDAATLVFRKNGVNTALSFIWNGTSEDQDDLVTEVSCVAGDMVDWQLYATGNVTGDGPRIAVSICFIADDPNQWWISRPKSFASLTAGAVTYGQPTLGDLESYTPWDATEYASPFSEGIKIEAIAVGLSTAPGIGNSRTFTLRVGGVDTAITVTISGASTFGIGTGTIVEPADFDMLSLSNAMAGTAAASRGSIALVGSYVELPTVDTDPATNLCLHSATFNGEITDLGIPADNADYRGFEWGVATGVYTDNWIESGAFIVEAYDHDNTSLLSCTTYFYRAMAHNPTAGWGYGSEVSFTTCCELLPDPPDGFVAIPIDCGEIELRWLNTNSENYCCEDFYPNLYVEIRRDDTGYPTDPPSDGTQLCFESAWPSGTHPLTDSGLSSGTTYYYRIWFFDHDTDNYTDYAEDFATTYACHGAPHDTDIPDIWSFTPTCDIYDDTPLIGVINATWVNWLGAPLTTGCVLTTLVLIGFISSISFGGGALMSGGAGGRTIVIPFLVSCILVVLCAMAHAIPMGPSIVFVVVFGGLGGWLWTRS